jgi:hypothetical protein
MTMNRSLSRSLMAALLFFTTTTWADGTLTHLSGPISVEKADGRKLAATPGAKLVAGDTVVTDAGAYARLEMTDGGEIVLRPDSRLKIESYKYNESKPQEDSAVFRMLKGGLRTVTGLIGKRGNRDAYEMKASTATIGIRGTQYDLRLCEGNCGALPDGTYVSVRFGAIHTANGFGGLDVGAGHVAHVPQSAPPVMLPRDPGIGFTPPPSIPKLDERKKQGAPTGGLAAADRSPAQPAGGESCAVE